MKEKITIDPAIFLQVSNLLDAAQKLLDTLDRGLPFSMKQHAAGERFNLRVVISILKNSIGKGAIMNPTKTIKKFYECSEAPEALPDFIRWMQAKLEEIPGEYTQSAKIEIRDYSEWYSPEYIISYTRPETAQEIKDRDAEIEAMKRRREADERKQLERLKRKYEVQS